MYPAVASQNSIEPESNGNFHGRGNLDTSDSRRMELPFAHRLERRIVENSMTANS